MQKSLFGKKITPKKKRTKLEIALQSHDKKSFIDRLERLSYLKKIFPRGFGFVSDLETAHIFDEVKMAFVNGEFISTMLLSQAFIERKFQNHYYSLGLQHISNRGMKAIIDHAKKNGIIHSYFLEKANELRKKRNPFVHLKEWGHEYNLGQRIYKMYNPKNQVKQPTEILFEDAKEAISLMYAVGVSNLN